MPSWFKTILTITLTTLGIGAIVVIFLLPTFRLELATQQLNLSVKRLQNLALKDRFNGACAGSQTTSSNNTAVSAYQIRFVNESDYVLEAICSRIGGGTVEVGSRSLPTGVTKTAGSGLIWPVQDVAGGTYESKSAITIASEDLSKVISLEEKLKISSGNKVASLIPGPNAPATTCEGWGLQCCPDAGFVGEIQFANPIINQRTSCFHTHQ